MSYPMPDRRVPRRRSDRRTWVAARESLRAQPRGRGCRRPATGGVRKRGDERAPVDASRPRRRLGRRADRADDFLRIRQRRLPVSDGTSENDQRGTPLNPPENGEKLPNPASVKERKNRWSAGTANDCRPWKL